MLKPCVTCGRLTYRHIELTWQCDKCRFSKLPPEVWTAIFNHLDAPDLLNIRLTCRTWKQIIHESPSLRQRMKIRIIGRKVTLDQDCEPVRLPPAAQIFIRVGVIVSVDSWWPAFGSRLVVLELFDNYISLKTLFGMLNQTPLLRELIMKDNHYFGTPVAVNFRLNHLEKFVMQEYDVGSMFILQLFSEICPRFKYLAVYQNCYQDLVLKLVEATQSTLERLKLNATNKMLNALSELKNLQLRHVTTLESTDNDPQIFSRFIRTQRSIDSLNIDLQNFQVLTDIVRHNLVRLTLNVYKNSTINLGIMPNLRNLKIVCPYRPLWVKFNDFVTPNLEELRLVYISIVDKLLLNNLLNCSKLHLLELHAVNVVVNLTILSSKFNSLKILNITVSHTSRNQLKNLFRLCPNIESLKLKLVHQVNNEVVKFLCKQLAHLKLLALSGRLGDSSASAIVRHHGPELRRLYFEDRSLSDESKRRLRERLSPRCSVQFCWVDDVVSNFQDMASF